MANNENLKPFKKGFDPRRNLKGVPRDAILMRKHMRKIAAELIGKDETEMTRLDALLRQLFTSRNPAHNKLALQVLDPKILAEHYEINEGNTEILDKFSIPAELIAPDFLSVYRDIMGGNSTEYVLHGGRGSTKSSFAALAIIYILVNTPNIHALAVRQVKDTLRDSVYTQLAWAVNELGLTDKFKMTVSPMEIEYLPTKQKIYFRGADDPAKLKSVKPPFGHIGILWLEELDQFHGAEAMRKIHQSAIRGGDEAYVFLTFNPPPTMSNWANKYIQVPKPRQYIHKSDYRTVPAEWLGRAFLDEAEHLREVNPSAYEHEYLGVPNFDGGAVFNNLEIRPITDDEIQTFDRVLHGLDWGWYPSPAHYVRAHYDADKRTLYIFGELRKHKTENEVLYRLMVESGYNANELLMADSAEDKSIGDFRAYGANIRGAEKGRLSGGRGGSVNYSMKWLQSLTAIVIDPARTPHAATEFQDYEYERTKDGEVIEAFPDDKNHSIDAVRYATNLIWRRRGE